MIGIFVDQNMRQQARTRPAAFNRARGQRHLGEAIAAGTGEARADDPVHNEAAGDVFEFLARHCPRTNGGQWLAILAQAAQLAAAMGASRVGRGQFDLDAGNMVRDRFALRLVGRCVLGLAQLCCHRGNGDLGRLQRQLQLLGSL